MFRPFRILALIVGLAIGTKTFAQTASESVPVSGIANVTFKVADLAKARSYYTGILGFGP